MSKARPGISGWVLRGVIFLLVAGAALVIQLDRSSRIRPALIAYVPAGLGGFADEKAARLFAVDFPDQALKRGEALLRHRPVEAANLSAYALAAVEGDRPEEAGQALTLAAQRGWRDTYTQVTVVGSALANQQWEVAAQRIDALSRMRREEEAIFGTISLLIGEEEGRQALADRMIESRPLTATVVEFLRANPDFGSRVAETFALTEGRDAALACEDHAKVVRTLLANSLGVEALSVWPERCHGDEQASYAFIFADPDERPFAWSYPSGAGISIREGDEAGSLDVRNRDPLRRQFAFRYVTLPPGTYTLQLSRKDEDVARRPGMGPSAQVSALMRCDRSESRFGALVAEVYRGPVEFTVADDCPVQYLALTASQGRVEGLRISID